MEQKLDSFEDVLIASGNGATKYKTSKDDFVDQFASLSKFKEPRSYELVAQDMKTLWRESPIKCMQFTAYIRNVTRQSTVVVGGQTSKLNSVQSGQGLKHEGLMRMYWLATNQRQAFVRNFHIFLATGSWKDVFNLLAYDLQTHGWKKRKLDWNFFGEAIMAGLHNPFHENLIKKYMPTIRSNSACTTLEAKAKNLVGKFLAKRLFGLPKNENDFSAYTKYRKFKSSGEAHLWQQKIATGEMLKIDFNTIPGRALSLLVGSKFLKNQGLEGHYYEWIKSRPVAKYTGYPYELLKPLYNVTNLSRFPEYQKLTIDKQFDGLIDLVKENKPTRLLVVRDTSGSMSSSIVGGKISSNFVAACMSLYFSRLMTGPFKSLELIFDNTVSERVWKDGSVCEAIIQPCKDAYGSTNFLAVADYLVAKKQKLDVSEDVFPEGILCISDGEFNSAGRANVTNFQAFRQRLVEGGFSQEFASNFKLILWDIPNNFYSLKPVPKFESFAGEENCFYMSGFDGSALNLLMGKPNQTPRNSVELFHAALNQDLYQMIE